MSSNGELSNLAPHNGMGLSEQPKSKKRKSKSNSKYKKYINSCRKTQNANKLTKEMKQQALQYFSENYDKHKQSLIELFYLIYE